MSSPPNRVRWVGLLMIAAFGAAMAGVLFGLTGRWRDPLLWAYIAIITAGGAASALVVDPSLQKERRKPGPGGVDRNFRWYVLPLFLVHWLIAGLDLGRYHWSDTMPAWLRVMGLVGLAAGMAVSIWAAGVNRFYSPVVRIQSERGHHLITAGPYGWVRHPGYLGSLLSLVLGGAALGSWWAMAPIAVAVALILRRARLEDRYLQEHLPGYVEYARRVRYRLVPGLW